jgi:hypothetical protein
MADIAAANVTYTEDVSSRQIECLKRKRSFVFTVAFGDGALTYPAGGVPLTKAKLGCPTVLDELVLLDPASASGYVWKWDRTNNKLRGYQQTDPAAAGGANIPLVELTAATTAPAAQSLKVKAVGW